MRPVADWEEVVDRLYRLPPDAFTAARQAAVAEARRAGDRELARRIGRLRRPTLAAWASNLLVRARPTEAEGLRHLGEALRDAHRDLDGGRLRELVRRQRQVVGALAHQAAELAAEAGRPISAAARREVEQTLHAALADEDAARAWTRGRLLRPLHAPAGLTPQAGPSPAAPDRAPDRDAARHAARHAARDDARQDVEAAAEDARRRWRDRERARTAAERAVRRAERRAAEARRVAEELTRRAQRAREAQQRAEEELRRARDHLTDATRDARHARRRAEEAAARTGRRGRTAG